MAISSYIMMVFPSIMFVIQFGSHQILCIHMIHQIQLNLGLPCWRSQVQNPLPAKARGLSSGSSSSHRACLVRVTSPLWFASYCIGAEVLPCAHPKGSRCGFPLT